MSLSCAALIATAGRPRELARLLASLAKIESGLSAIVVADNGRSDDTRSVVQAAGSAAHYVAPESNLGCGGGLQLAGECALKIRGERFTHFLFLDDDAVLAPDTIKRLAAAMDAAGADLAYPLVIGPDGHVGWTPGVIGLSRQIERAPGLTPEDFRERFGREPRAVSWSQGICLLVTRRAIEARGWHRGDFWVRGEDLEFSLRMTAGAAGIFVPAVVVQHLPPEETADVSREAEYLKHCALVQNIAFVGLRLPHGRRIAWTLAGALRRFFRLWKSPALADAARALWRGAVLGEPAGAGGGRTFRVRCAALGGAR